MQETQEKQIWWKSRRSPEGGRGNPPQCSCLENSIGSGAWRATVRGAAKNRTGPRDWAHPRESSLSPRGNCLGSGSYSALYTLGGVQLPDVTSLSVLTFSLIFLSSALCLCLFKGSILTCLFRIVILLEEHIKNCFTNVKSVLIGGTWVMLKASENSSLISDMALHFLLCMTLSTFLKDIFFFRLFYSKVKYIYIYVYVYVFLYTQML